MVIKDFYCSLCGDTKHNIVVDSCNVSEVTLSCIPCETYTKHLSQCNGGLGKRYRFADWNVEDVRREIKYTGVGAEVEGKPITDIHTGEIYHNQKRFSSEAIDERRKIQEHKRQFTRGGNNLFFDRATSAQR